MPESVEAAAERGIDIAGHVARAALDPSMVAQADLIARAWPPSTATPWRAGAAGRGRATFTLKELVRLARGRAAGAARPGGPRTCRPRRRGRRAAPTAGSPGDPRDEDVVDPLGMPLEAYRAIAWELDDVDRPARRGALRAGSGRRAGRPEER